MPDSIDGGAVMPALTEGEASAAEYRGLLRGAEIGAAAAGAAAVQTTAEAIADAMPSTLYTVARRNRRLALAVQNAAIAVYSLPSVISDVLVERITIGWPQGATPVIGQHLGATVFVGQMPVLEEMVGANPGAALPDSIRIAQAYVPSVPADFSTFQSPSITFDFSQPVYVPGDQKLIVATFAPAGDASAQWVEVPEGAGQ